METRQASRASQGGNRVSRGRSRASQGRNRASQGRNRASQIRNSDRIIQHSPFEEAASSHDIHKESREASRIVVHEQQIAEEERSEEYFSAELITGPTARTRKRTPLSLQNESLHTHLTPSPERSRFKDSSLTTKTNDLYYFRSGSADFVDLLMREKQAYFDRTRYISVLHKIDRYILFFRPRRFGKTLTVRMLEHFHGIQYKHQHESLYQGLDVQKDIEQGTVTPGQYFILTFDFSCIERSPIPERALKSLIKCFTTSFKRFYRRYSIYWGGDVSELLNLIDPEDPAMSLQECVMWVDTLLQTTQESGDRRLANVQGIYLLADEYDTFSNDYTDPYKGTAWEGTAVEQLFKSFWSTVKSLLGPTTGIPRAFITGISPLSLTDIGSGFNVARNLSFDPDVSGLCGLTRTDVEAALKKVCGSDINAYNNHLAVMTKHYNGYHFCKQKTVETVYNTETCLYYLQHVIEGKIPDTEDPPNSEVSEQFLKKFAASASAIRDFQEALNPGEEDGEFQLLPYTALKQSFKLADLSRDIESSQPAWRSLMIYFGGLTFYAENPAKFLKIPNAIAARRIAESVLQKYGLLESLHSALNLLQTDGDIRCLLSCYQDLMVQRDVGYSDFNKSEDIHRDSFYFTLIQNHFYRPHPEFIVTRSSGKSGRVDLIIPLHEHLIVTEWKVAQIDYLDIRIPGGRQPSRENKASALSEYTLSQVLQLKFGAWDKFRPGQTVQHWMEREAASQLKDYIRSQQVVKLLKDGKFLMRAHLVLIVGSRHILMWDMDCSGELVDTPYLAGKRHG